MNAAPSKARGVIRIANIRRASMQFFEEFQQTFKRAGCYEHTTGGTISFNQFATAIAEKIRAGQDGPSLRGSCPIEPIKAHLNIPAAKLKRELKSSYFRLAFFAAGFFGAGFLAGFAAAFFAGAFAGADGFGGCAFDGSGLALFSGTTGGLAAAGAALAGGAVACAVAPPGVLAAGAAPAAAATSALLGLRPRFFGAAGKG